MTYCVAVCLNEGLVFLSDTRTNAGVDDIGTFRKMTIYQKDSDRIFTLLSAGNLAITQSKKKSLPRALNLMIRIFGMLKMLMTQL